MVVRPDEVVEGEVVLALVEPRAAADDLLELDHRIDRPQQHDVAHVARIHAGRQLLRGGQDRRDGFLVVLEVAQPLLAERAVVGRDALAVVGIGARLDLVDEVADRQRMGLVGAEHQRLFARVDLAHENLDALLLALANLDDAVEILFLVALAGLDLALDHGVVGREHVVVERRGDLLDAEGRQEAVVDAVPERIDEHRLAEVGVGVDVVLALRCRRQAQLHGRREVVEDAAPVALVVGAAAMALVDDDEVEEVLRILAEIRGFPRPAHEGLEDGEEQAAVLRHLALLADVVRRDAHQRIVGECRKRVVGLVGEDVAVGEEQDARPARRFAAQVPAAVEQLPGNLEGDEGLARAGRQRQQDAIAPPGQRRQHALDGDVLVVAPLEEAAPVLEGHGGEAVAPGVGRGEGEVPDLVGRRKAGPFAFRAGLHVDAVDAPPVAGVGEADRQLAGVVLGLADALGEFLVPGLGLHHRQPGVAVFEDVVRAQGLAAPSRALQPPGRDRVFAPDAAALDPAPAGGGEGRVDVLGAGLGFVHAFFRT